MKVLKTKFTTWEESDGIARDNNVEDDDANAPTASMPGDSATAAPDSRNFDAGSRPYAGDVSSPGAGGSSSRSSRDSLFKPKRAEGSAFRFG